MQPVINHNSILLCHKKYCNTSNRRLFKTIAIKLGPIKYKLNDALIEFSVDKII